MQFERLYILNHSVETLFTHVVDSVNSPKSWERFVALLVHSVSVHPYLYPHQQKVLKCLIFIHICDGCGMQFFESLYSLNHSQPSLLVWCWRWDYEGSAGHRTAANGRLGGRGRDLEGRRRRGEGRDGASEDTCGCRGESDHCFSSFLDCRRCCCCYVRCHRLMVT